MSPLQFGRCVDLNKARMIAALQEHRPHHSLIELIESPPERKLLQEGRPCNSQVG